MTITSMLVSLHLGRSNDAPLRVAAGLAARFGAHAEGIALCQPIHISASDAYLVSDLAVEDREERLQQMAVAEAAFRQALTGRARSTAWHAEIILSNLSAAVATEARSHDLIVVGAETSHPFSDPVPPVHLGDLVLQAGRPILVVPAAVETLALDHVLLAWKDGCPARRAAADSLPLLRSAKRVTVAEVVPAADTAEAEKRLRAIAVWLSRHGIHAETKVLAETGEDAGRLAALAQDLGIDLIIAGAYAHHRLQEQIFGGVTRSLMAQKERCILLSH
jgi:nucleotide-binding universal stress UspA family protein